MYWGGGTASILSCAEIETLHGALADALPLDGIAEATIESSPESLTLDKLRLLRGLGFNRISIGVQAFDDDRLRMIGRAHSAEVAESSIALARQAGFDNVNIDLIVGFPDQDLAEVERTINKAITLPVNHFSIYAYRASQGTVLRRRLDRAKAKTDLAKQLRAYQLSAEILTANGCPRIHLRLLRRADLPGRPVLLPDEAGLDRFRLRGVLGTGRPDQGLPARQAAHIHRRSRPRSTMTCPCRRNPRR